ncbi:alpha/beta fold hydrolase [Mycolicibacterium frederiksbergense]|nr:alpha/beta hydrolase [Mycolicibacterium frederiksbergense]
MRPRVVTGAAALIAMAATTYALNNLTYAARQARRVAAAGFVERRIALNGSTLNYAVGPDNGPPLLLIHGQITDWRSWSRVLPALSRTHHVFAVDCPGHGGSDHNPYTYQAVAQADAMRRFLAGAVGAPSLVAGHSSGGLVAAILAADSPEWVRGVVLEDPPFFSSVLPAAEKTFNYVGLATVAHNFLASGRIDFTNYFLQHAGIWQLFGKLAGPLQRSGMRNRLRHPDKPVRFPVLPPSVNELFRAVDCYDPRFGAMFYDNSFHDGFDHARTLQRITVPVALMHANWHHDKDGVLLAAMSGADAARARSLLRGATFHRVDSGHNIHFEKPREFLAVVAALTQRL